MSPAAIRADRLAQRVRNGPVAGSHAGRDGENHASARRIVNARRFRVVLVVFIKVQ